MLNSRANGTPECNFEILLPNRGGADGGRLVAADGILPGVKARAVAAGDSAAWHQPTKSIILLM
jgi:hypothetical protein